MPLELKVWITQTGWCDRPEEQVLMGIQTDLDYVSERWVVDHVREWMKAHADQEYEEWMYWQMGIGREEMPRPVRLRVKQRGCPHVERLDWLQACRGVIELQH